MEVSLEDVLHYHHNRILAINDFSKNLYTIFVYTQFI